MRKRNKRKNKAIRKKTKPVKNQSATGIETEISIPSDWNISNEERYVYAFHNNESPKLKPNQISIYGMELMEEEKGVTITGLIRSTVPKEIHFESAVILLLNDKHEVIARKEFDLSGLGTIPQNGARPWKFTFAESDFGNDAQIPATGWSLAFEIKNKHRLELEDSWEKSIADETRAGLEKIIEQAPSLKEGEINFMGVQAKQHENKDIAVTILIRNGADKNMTLEKVPLGMKDASDEEIARGSFTLENFQVSANTSKPWTFIFPASTVKKEEIDLSKWQVFPIQ